MRWVDTLGLFNPIRGCYVIISLTTGFTGGYSYLSLSGLFHYVSIILNSKIKNPEGIKFE